MEDLPPVVSKIIQTRSAREPNFKKKTTYFLHIHMVRSNYLKSKKLFTAAGKTVIFGITSSNRPGSIFRI